MITKEEMLRNNVYENEILEVVDNQDDYTRSDLQGRVGAIVMNIIRETNQLNKAKLEEVFERIEPNAAAEHQGGEDYRIGFADGLDQAVFMIRELMASA